ncbi:MAG: fibronectin type III domain-containing protein [Ruminococcus sp.]|nr:fibronectin type III domain-containing protein [Ruminococcus sp.]
MKQGKKLTSIISIVLATLMLASTITVGATTFKSIKKNSEFHYGVDVSTFNGTYDFDEIKKDGIEFMFIRLGYYKNDGGHLDTRFLDNVKGCVENGIEFGVYVYSYIYNAEDIKDCAKWVNEELGNLGNYTKDKGTIQVAYDIEDQAQKDAVAKGEITKSKLNKNVETFCSKIKGYGYVPVVYSSQYYFQNYLDLTDLQKNGIKIWYAQWPYTSSLDTTKKKLMYNDTYADIWQFSSSLTLDGKVFDTNVCYNDFYDYNKESSKLTAKGLKASYEYTGSAIKPDFKIYDGDTLLTKDTDYKVFFFNNKKQGRASVKIVRFDSEGNYLETKTFFFAIKPAKVSSIKASTSYNYAKLSFEKSSGATKYYIYKKSGTTYTKLDKTSSTTFKIKSLKEGKKYTYAVRAYKVIKDKGYYSDYTDVTFYTKYKKVAIKKAVSTSKKTVTVKWTPKKSKTKGYQVQYSRSKSFANSKIVTVNSKSKSKVKINNLKSGKKYYFRVRSFNTVDKKTIYSVYSSNLNTKVK